MSFCLIGGLRACPWCKNDGKYCNFCKKTEYQGGRKFLPEDSPLRKSTLFPGEKEETAKAQPIKKAEQIELRNKFENLPNKTQKAKFSKANGVTGKN